MEATKTQNIKKKIEAKLNIGSLNWLSLDILTLTNFIAQHDNQATPSHVNASKYVLRHLKGSTEI